MPRYMVQRTFPEGLHIPIETAERGSAAGSSSETPRTA
jgi:hypothetical protein